MRSVKPLCGIAAAALCAALSNAAAANPPAGPAFTELGHLIPGFGETARSRFAIGDVDGDGLPDMAFVARATDEVLFVLGKQNGTLALKQASPVPDTTVVRVLSAPGGDGVYTLADDGKLRHYTGWPLRESGNVTVTASATAAAIADINNDGQPELVVCTYGTLAVHALASGNLLWSQASSGGYDLALAQLDGDPALEIVIANTPGKVIDGATQAVDWQFKDGFGNYLAAGHFGTNSENRFVAARDWNSFAVFRGAPWSPLWDHAQNDIDAIAGADLDGDGVDEILQGDGQWGAVHVIDSNTHLQRFSVPNPGYGMNAIATGDVDGDGAKEIVFGAGSYDNRTLFVADAQTGNVDWSYEGQAGAFTVAAVGDLDGDGRAEQIVGANNGSSPGGVRILDAASGNELWRAPTNAGNANDPFYISPARILIGQLDNDPQQEIVVAGSAIYDGRIVILDGVTHQVQRQIGYYSTSGPLQGRYLVDAALVNYDGDGFADIVVASYPALSSANGAKLLVFSGATGDLLWESVAMGSGFSTMNGVLVGNVDADPQPELIAVLPTGLRAYDSQTQLLEWSLAATADGALLLPYGVGGKELVVFNHSGNVTFYDAVTRGFLRSMALPSPLNAIIAPDGDAAFLLAAGAGKLHLVDGVTKTVLASSALLGSRTAEGNQLGTWQLGPQSWHVGAGSAVGIFRYRLDTSDVILANGFD